METKVKYGVIAIAIIAIIGISVGGYAAFYYSTGSYKTPLKVYHAGSLAVPMQEIEALYESDHPNIDVRLESAGSVDCVKKITEQNKPCDVLALADWSLIPKMDKQYQNYTIQFATNQMVLCYYGSLPSGHGEINATNFWEYLNASGIEWGFSNPNKDPCGYRTLMVLQLAELNYSKNNILDDLVMDDIAGITCSDDGENYTITCVEDLSYNAETSNVNIRDKSVDLITLLEEGVLDYAFEYMSVAIQHKLNFIALEPILALNESVLDEYYGKVKVKKSDDSTSTGKSITYGITVPLNADHPDLGAEFVEYVINEVGKEIFEDLGQPVLTPCPTENYGTWIPQNLYQYCCPIT
ncbi:MAG: tungstate ABC transporter substrate-binding protein WtpA [Candidatus Lokiarchaeota archaeon]|nr:tungstate ABC transporter substrate-binding protein WtpA [Candidatus Lokiarchaeota archaeon]